MASEEAVQILDDVKDLAKDSAEWVNEGLDQVTENYQGPLLNSRNKMLLIGIGCTALGLTVGYFVAAHRLRVKYQRLADQQVEEVKSRYTVPRIMPDADKPSLDDLRAEIEKDEASKVAAEIINEQGYTSYNKVETPADLVEDEEAEVVKVEERNIFENNNEGWDQSAEEEYRRLNPDKPYLLSEAEFNDNETDYDQATLTYWSGDDTLADSQDRPVEEEVTIGDDAVSRFGHGSNDPNVVYVRNDKLQCDFEVLKSEGKYADEVLGNQQSLRHSDGPKVRKFRQDRD